MYSTLVLSFLFIISAQQISAQKPVLILKDNMPPEPFPTDITNGTTTLKPPPTNATTTVAPPPSPTNATTTVKPPPSPTNATTTVKPSPSPTNATTTVKPQPSPTNATTTTTTTTPPPPTTSKPEPSDRKFDGFSFLGGFCLALGLVAIVILAWKFYVSRQHDIYRTL